MMPHTLSTSRKRIAVEAVEQLAAPAWVERLLAGAPEQIAFGVRFRCGDDFCLLSARVEDVPNLSAGEFELQTFQAYASIARVLADLPGRRAVRFWNHVPLITEPADSGRDHYMVFNAGRFRAFSDWYACPSRFERDVATATGVGHGGRDLVIHCLAATGGATPVNNPRQVAPYHYSQRFGPLPPCFARATRLDHPARLLLVGGTASVRGEDSVHVGDLAAQCSETFMNLAALVGAAMGKKLAGSIRLRRWLSAFRELRVYHPTPSDRSAIESAILAQFGGVERIEWLCADLCRAELRVEIEGIADLCALESPLKP
jgi:chorismate lyase/3-hydroxybenzoate synthase